MSPTNYTCSICSKGFEKRTSQIRHISYCRKSKSRGRSRKKACLNCTKAKTHCNSAYPNCARCVAKDLSCRYERPPISRASDVAQSTSLDETEEPTLISNLSRDLSLESPMQLVQVDSSTDELPLASNFDCLDSTYDVPYLYDTSLSEAASLQNTRGPSPLSYSEPKSCPDFSNTEVVDTLTFERLFPKPPKAFDLRTMRNHQFSLNRKYMLCTLRSYPFMMIPGKTQTLPAFIHPQSLGYKRKNDRFLNNRLLSPLENCLAIVQMWSVKNKANARLIWRTIRMEQERVLAEISQYDDWNTVAALQAITIYILLRLSENDDDVTDFDLPLIRTMIKVALRTSGIEMRHLYSHKGSPTWESWVLAESLLRTLIVLFLIDILFNFSSLLHPYKCDGSELLGKALPCGRHLWYASSRAEWEREYTRQGVGKQLTYGDLVNNKLGTDGALDSWLEQLDDFGTLVRAAASLKDG